MNQARRAQLAQALEIIDTAEAEESEAFENLPEGIQDSERGEAMQEAADQLQEIADLLREIVEA